MQPLPDVGGGNGAHIVDGGELLLRGGGQGVKGPEVGGQDLPRLLSHLPDAQGVEEPLQSPVPAGGDGRHQIGGGLLPHPVQGGQLLLPEEVEVRRALHQPPVNELGHDGGTQPLDVHGVPAGKVGQVPVELGGALRPGTADGRAVRVPGHRGPTHRAQLRQMVGHRPLRPEIGEDLHHLGDDLPGLLEDHCVSDADVLLINEVLVVESCVGDGGPRQPHRLHNDLGGQHPGAAHLDHNVQYLGGLPLRGILVGNGPPGTLGSTPQGGAV